MRREPDTARVARVLLPLLLAITVVGIVDLILDRPTELLSLHVLVDVALVALSLGTALYLWLGFLMAERSLERTLDALEESSAERDAWRDRTEELIRGLGAALEDVFEGWDLTPTERETALLLLKGLSHKRIARQSGRSERTIRQHAVSVYRKSGLGGRAALSGFFLDQLVLPDAAGERPPPPPGGR